MLSSDELRVASATGIGVAVKKPLIQAFERWGIEILGINQCQNVEFDNSKSLEYLRGGAPTWQIFHYNESGRIIFKQWLQLSQWSVAQWLA